MKDNFMEIFDLIAWAVVILIVFLLARNTYVSIQTMSPNDAVLTVLWSGFVLLIFCVQFGRLFSVYMDSTGYKEMNKRRNEKLRADAILRSREKEQKRINPRPPFK